MKVRKEVSIISSGVKSSNTLLKSSKPALVMACGLVSTLSWKCWMVSSSHFKVSLRSFCSGMGSWAFSQSLDCLSKTFFSKVSKTFCVSDLMDPEMLSPSAGWMSSPPSGSDGGMLVGLSGG